MSNLLMMPAIGSPGKRFSARAIENDIALIRLRLGN